MASHAVEHSDYAAYHGGGAISCAAQQFCVAEQMSFPREITSIVINWHGPFSSLEQARLGTIDGEVEEIIYLAVNERNRAYAGISKSAATRLTDAHHVLGEIGPGEADLWIGVLASQRVWTASDALHSTAIRLAEHATVYSLELSENQRLRNTPPDRSIMLMNRWYEGQDPYKRWPNRGHKNWPDLIEYDQGTETVRLVWFDGRLESWQI
jgi:hypothetical protein